MYLQRNQICINNRSFSNLSFHRHLSNKRGYESKHEAGTQCDASPLAYTTYVIHSFSKSRQVKIWRHSHTLCNAALMCMKKPESEEGDCVFLCSVLESVCPFMPPFYWFICRWHFWHCQYFISRSSLKTRILLGLVVFVFGLGRKTNCTLCAAHSANLHWTGC